MLANDESRITLIIVRSLWKVPVLCVVHKFDWAGCRHLKPLNHYHGVAVDLMVCLLKHLQFWYILKSNIDS